MKHFIAKLAANMNHLRSSIKHVFDTYGENHDDLRETPVIPVLYEDYEMLCK